MCHCSPHKSACGRGAAPAQRWHHPSHAEIFRRLLDGRGQGLREASNSALTWAVPRAEAAVEWVTPRAKAAWQTGVIAAAPRVDQAARALSPKIDIARDKLRDQVLPAVVEAVNHAAEVAAQQAGTPVAQVAVVTKKPHKLRRFLVWAALLSAVSTVAYAIFRHRQPALDPWAEDAWEAESVTFTPTSQASPADDGSTHHETWNELADAAGEAAETVGEVTGVAVRKVSDAAHKAADATQKASEAVADAAKTATSAARRATSRSRKSETPSADDDTDESTES